MQDELCSQLTTTLKDVSVMLHALGLCGVPGELHFEGCLEALTHTCKEPCEKGSQLLHIDLSSTALDGTPGKASMRAHQLGKSCDTHTLLGQGGTPAAVGCLTESVR